MRKVETDITPAEAKLAHRIITEQVVTKFESDEELVIEKLIGLLWELGA